MTWLTIATHGPHPPWFLSKWHLSPIKRLKQRYFLELRNTPVLHCSHALTLLHSFAHTRTRTNALPLFWKLIEFRPFWVALLRYHRWLVRSFFLTKYDIKSTHFMSAQKPSLVTPNIRCVPPSSKPLITTNSSIWALYNSLGAYCVLLCVRLQKFWWTEHVTRNGGLIYNAPP